MVTRSHLQLVPPETPALDALRTRLLSAAGAQHELIARALDFIEPLYQGRTLAGGQPVLAHALDVAQTLSELKLDADALAAALLCRAHENSADTARVIRETFGAGIAELCEGVVRMAQIGALSNRERAPQKPQQQAAQLEALRKMLLAMVQDVRVVLIKLADHLQVLRFALRADDTGLRRATAELTRDIFAPLANRLGVWHLKWELEDLSFRILEPDTYKTIALALDEKRLDRERYIEALIEVLKGELARAGVAAEVSGRPKHLFSIYNKMTRKNVGFEALHDVRAVRVLVQDVKDCYAALGLVHSLWSPIPKEFDDYVAKPKANNYRSLHTAVIGPDGKAVEVQIRTYEMHQHSELGIAAHWRYKEDARHDRGFDDKIAWLRQVLEWKDEVADTDAGELAEQFKTEFSADTVYVLTPQGRVVDLPQGATPIDFAYHVHTELGHRCRGAKVDGAIVPLSTPLHNGQQVEILAAKQGGPSRDWLNPMLGFLKSQGARTKVRQWFNRQNFEADLAHGRAMLDKELQRQGMTALNLDKVAADAGYARLNEFLVDLARGAIGPKLLQETLKPPVEPQTADALPLARKSRSASRSSVLIVGVDKLLTLTARCCKPAPPEPIVGFVTRGRGVSVHRANCSNLKRLDPERRVDAEWGDAAGASFPVDVVVEAVDRTGLLRDISDVLTRERINVTATATQSASYMARMRFTLEVEDLEQLKRVLGFVRDVKGVMSAVRR